MSEQRMIQCPACNDAGLVCNDVGDAICCAMCNGSGTIPDRRKVDRNVPGYCGFCFSFHAPGAPHTKSYPEVDRRSPSAADRAVERIKDLATTPDMHSGKWGAGASDVLLWVLDIIREEAER